jgi:hypothetical protein
LSIQISLFFFIDTHQETTSYYAYHWPGLSGNESRLFGNDEEQVMNIFRNYSVKFQSKTEKNPYQNEPPYPPPFLLPAASIDGEVGLQWTGSAGARNYLIEKSVNCKESFQKLAVVQDNMPSGSIIFTDGNSSTPSSNKVYYRVYAMNENGKSQSSNILSV